MKIIGAGMSGMLAGQFFRSRCPTILEKQSTLPNNHKALLRFRSDIVSDLTGIEFKKVKVQKMIRYGGQNIFNSDLFLNNMYSQKVTGGIYSRSALDLSPAERFIAPDDFINRLSKGLDIVYEEDAEAAIKMQILDSSTPLISTMPVTELAKILGAEIKQPEHRPIWSISFDIADIGCDVYQTVYYPCPHTPFYRISITGNKVIAEFCRDYKKDEYFLDLENAKQVICNIINIDFGISFDDIKNVEYNFQKYGKLVECDDKSVKDFIGQATRYHNIYSLGRWGTHRQLLMDDVVNDLKVIGRMIHSNQYKR